MGYLETRAGLAGKVAVIFGGGGGLGRAAAQDLGRAGVRLWLADRNEELLSATADELRSSGVELMSEVLDARDPEALSACFSRVDDTYGPLDVLVNVVGGTFKQSFEESNPRGWDAIIRTNFTWLLHATHLAIPRMKAKGGSIINLTSIEGHRAAPDYAVYAGMKGAVINFTRTVAIELAPYQIRVNTIAPDKIPTEGSTALVTDDADRELDELSPRISVPMGRKGVYEDLGGCVLFLASDLSRYVTGTSMHPDGGALASSGWFNWPGAGFLNSPPAEVVREFRDAWLTRE